MYFGASNAGVVSCRLLPKWRTVPTLTELGVIQGFNAPSVSLPYYKRSSSLRLAVALQNEQNLERFLHCLATDTLITHFLVSLFPTQAVPLLGLASSTSAELHTLRPGVNDSTP